MNSEKRYINEFKIEAVKQVTETIFCYLDSIMPLSVMSLDEYLLLLYGLVILL